ncbi:hemerythrin domain-containing protein [Desulfohalovibrio reitneri]|uniref:hemerythrin domain-containing protein n=1 Tax=Desulfohalovibrio reitneri TaxID=1307759 RepID=UPI0004A76109|nr:hemerythrin domain-containing protein [Desulfohalovibrio reitneri]
MQPIGPLMWEHRLIEQMVDLIGREADRLDCGGEPDIHFAMQCADFLSVYADALHHGKEERILFRELKKKDISPKHKEIMNGLEEDHKLGRELVSRLRSSAKAFGNEPELAFEDIRISLRELVRLYPRHIRTEDRDFFHQVMDYFSRDEMDSMLAEYHNVARDVLYDKYQSVVDDLREKFT